MGRKARKTKAEVRQPISILKSPLQLPISAAEGDLFNASAELTYGTPHSVSKKNLKSAIAIIRRSQRIKKTTRNLEIEHVIQEIDISESEREEPPPHDEENKSLDDSSDKEQEENNPADIKYESMYISSQKKIEALLEKNRELSKDLEHALGKADMYEKQSHIYAEVMTVISSLCKVNENLFAQVKDGVVADTTEAEGTVSKKIKRG